MANATFDVRALPTQELEIAARGEQLQWLDSNAPADRLDDERVRPDVVGVFARAVEAGVMPRADPAHPVHAAVRERRFDADAGMQIWHLEVGNLAPSALTILVNLLRSADADGFTAIEIRTAGSASRDAPAIGSSLPDAPDDLPFPVQREEPLRSGRDRDVSVSFDAPLATAFADRLIDALEAWCRVVACGGYPREDRRGPAGGVAEPPFQFDGYTVQVEFPEYFESDEAAFNGVLELALAAHREGVTVAEVVIR